MKMRQLGRSGFEVSELGLGCMGLSHAYDTAVDQTRGVPFLRAAHDLGVAF
ncbi:hypothetical protein [Breoghania sp.]|uniref:hypothetical protein n=1 Tax=Breoghania sp. TaxID=2065378 RepID=UPI0026172119|nr:hypothetical protein [Breoghania sp.]MDJ0930571.1 hypothetical protein [Breoghania sp.]